MAILSPTNFFSTGSNTQVYLEWKTGSGAQGTIVNAKLNQYPASYNTDTIVYSGTGNSVTHSGLTNGDAWFYRAWAYSGVVEPSGYTNNICYPLTSGIILSVDDTNGYVSYYGDADRDFVYFGTYSNTSNIYRVYKVGQSDMKVSGYIEIIDTALNSMSTAKIDDYDPTYIYVGTRSSSSPRVYKVSTDTLVVASSWDCPIALNKLCYGFEMDDTYVYAGIYDGDGGVSGINVGGVASGYIYKILKSNLTTVSSVELPILSMVQDMLLHEGHLYTTMDDGGTYKVKTSDMSIIGVNNSPGGNDVIDYDGKYFFVGCATDSTLQKLDHDLGLIESWYPPSGETSTIINALRYNGQHLLVGLGQTASVGKIYVLNPDTLDTYGVVSPVSSLAGIYQLNVKDEDFFYAGVTYSGGGYKPKFILKMEDPYWTTPTNPSVSTSTPTTVNATTVSGIGVISSNGGNRILDKGFCYVSGVGTPTISDIVVHDYEVESGNYSLSIASLVSGASYSIRAFVRTGTGTGYGDVVTFNTVSGVSVSSGLLISHLTGEGTTEEQYLNSDHHSVHLNGQQAGDIIYALDSTTLARLPIGSGVLISISGFPVWSTSIPSGWIV
jgi:hypothetical protein